MFHNIKPPCLKKTKSSFKPYSYLRTEYKEPQPKKGVYEAMSIHAYVLLCFWFWWHTGARSVFSVRLYPKAGTEYILSDNFDLYVLEQGFPHTEDKQEVTVLCWNAAAAQRKNTQERYREEISMKTEKNTLCKNEIT